MTENLTQNIQDYLKSIYELSARDGSVTTTALAERLGITPASVTGMLQRMAAAQPALVTYRKYQGAALTPAGERAALQVIRCHRLLEAYLVERLGYSWDTVHEEACRLEHVISPDLERRIAADLGDPQRDPHGEPIPTALLDMPRQVSLPLSELRPPQRAVVGRVSSDEPDFLRYLAEAGLVLGAHVQVLEYTPYDHNLRLRLAEQERVFGPAVTERVFVELIG
jgi:DtxR family Mn-dependent transcriptional regulator